MIKFFALTLFLLAGCTKGSDALPDFRGFTPSKTSLDDFKKSADFKNCKEVIGDFYQDLAYVYECQNISPHIEKLELFFSRANNNILVNLKVKFKDEKNVRTGSQSVYAPLLAKLSIGNTKPAKIMSKSQIIQFINDNQFRFECSSTQCDGELHYNGNFQSSFISMWYASGPAMLELDLGDKDQVLNLINAAQERVDKNNLKKAGGLGI